MKGFQPRIGSLTGVFQNGTRFRAYFRTVGINSKNSYFVLHVRDRIGRSKNMRDEGAITVYVVVPGKHCCNSIRMSFNQMRQSKKHPRACIPVQRLNQNV